MRKLGTALALAAFVLVRPALSIATDYSPQAVYALDGKVSCFVRNESFFSTSVGACNAFTPPRQVAVGATFVANGKQRTIGAIRAIQADEDWTYGNVAMKKGEWACSAGESETDVADSGHSALWLSIMKCQPMN